METPYGEIPDKFVKDMSAQEMHDYVNRPRHSRRKFLAGAGAAGLAATAGPIFWRQSVAAAATAGSPVGPQWIAYGPDSTSQMWVSWSAGNATTAANVPAPVVRYGIDATYGSTVTASTATVPTPAGAPAGNTELTAYQHALISNLAPNTTYHYSVSNDGSTWGPDTIFRTGKTGLVNFRFCATADENSFAGSSKPIMQSVQSFDPDFTIVAGDISYAGNDGTYKGTGPVATYTPSAWDSYFSVLGNNGGQNIPWMIGPGNHDVEPFTDNGFAGLVTRFPHFGVNANNAGSGSKVVQSFAYSNVGVIGLDDSDVSAIDTVNNGYTGGNQTSWFVQQLQKFRAPGSGIDFIVVFFHHCPYCSGGPGSDGGDRQVWQPLFDQYNVDVVINGHNHLYERTYPLINNQVQAQIQPGGTTYPATQGTTYICTGGGGQSLAATATSGWFGPSGGGDETNLTTATPLEVFSGGETAKGGSGSPTAENDPVTGWSAYRKGQYIHLVIDVTVPTAKGGQTSMHIQTIDPMQSGATISSISPPNVVDSVTLVRNSTTGPSPALPEVPDVALLGVAAAGVVGAGAYLSHRRSSSSEGDQPA